MNLRVPSSDLLCNKLMGIIVCVIFVVRQHHPFDQFPHICKGRDSRNTHEFSCSIYVNRCRIFIMGISLSKEFGKIESYQLSVRYFPSRSFFGNWKEELNRFDTNGFSQIEVTFKTKGPGLEVTKCGANLVFEQDIKDLKHTKAWPSSCSITPNNGDGAGTSEEAMTSNDIDRRTTPKVDTTP